MYFTFYSCDSPVQVPITDYVCMQSEQGKEDQGNLLKCVVQFVEGMHFVEFNVSWFFCCTEKIEALQNIFPNAEHAQLSAACMEAMGDINKAVDIVLDKGE